MIIIIEVTSGGDSRGHEYGRLPGAEAAQCILALALCAVAVDGRHRIPVHIQELL